MYGWWRQPWQSQQPKELAAAQAAVGVDCRYDSLKFSQRTEVAMFVSSSSAVAVAEATINIFR